MVHFGIGFKKARGAWCKPGVDCDLNFSGDAGSGPSSRNASVERGGERQSDTSDSETTDVRRINQQPFNREGRYDPNRWVFSITTNTHFDSPLDVKTNLDICLISSSVSSFLDITTPSLADISISHWESNFCSPTQVPTALWKRE